MFSKVKGYETNYDSLLSCVLRTSYELEIVLPVLQIKSNQNKTIVRDSWKKVLFGHHYLGLNNLTKQFIEICQYFVNIYQRCKKILQTGLFAFFISLNNNHFKYLTGKELPNICIPRTLWIYLPIEPSEPEEQEGRGALCVQWDFMWTFPGNQDTAVK